MKVAVGLSGGVDSTVAALLLREQGHEVVGVTMTLGRADEEASVRAAREMADRLGISFHVFDFAEAWRTNVLAYVRDTYLAGETPNPCVRCNETVKFSLLPEAAFALGCARFATGHYARLESSASGVRLLRGADRTKDQSYFLYRVRPDILARTLFPLGGLTKSEVRARARAFGLSVADRNDSQDFCGGDPQSLVSRQPQEGNIVCSDGRVLGRHAGYWNYTVGQRKGLGIGGGTPYFVLALKAATNEVVVGSREEAFVTSFSVRDAVRLVPDAAGGELTVKVRSAGDPKGPVTWDGATVRCPTGLAGVAPGQSAVLYRGDEIVGGGIVGRQGEA